MTDVEFTPLPDGSANGAMPSPPTPADLTRLTDVTVELTVEVGRTRMSLGETMSLGQGSVVTLSRGQIVYGRDLKARRLRQRFERHTIPRRFGPLVVQRLLMLDPRRLHELRAQDSGGLTPIDAPYLTDLLRLGIDRSSAGELVQNARTQRGAPANVQEHSVAVEETIHPGPIRQFIGKSFRQIRRQLVCLQYFMDRSAEPLAWLFGKQLVPEIGEHARVTQGAVPSAA